MRTPFMERLHRAIASKGAPVVVGLDPRPSLFPEDVWGPEGSGGDDPRRNTADAIVRFNELILDAIHDVAVAVKPQLAFYERWGWPGVMALERTMRMAKERDLLVIADGKRNDIGSTAEAYAQTYLGVPMPDGLAVSSGLEADALTVNPYLGVDGLQPFVDKCVGGGKAVFVLARTSNPSSAQLQQLQTVDASARNEPSSRGGAGPTVAERVADVIVSLNEGLPRSSGYGPVGAVVGATHPEEARRLRSRMPGVMMLVPGYGAQGAGAKDARAAFDEGGRGAIVNSARGILYAWHAQRPGGEGTGDNFAKAARRAALSMQAELRGVLL